MSLGQSNRGVKKENLYIFSSLSLLLMLTITTQTRAAGKKGLQRCKSTTKIISVTITPLNWACCFHLRERLSSYFTFSFLQYSREGSYGLEEFHDDSEQACALWCNRYTTCKEAIINFEKYSARQSNIFSALSNWIFFCRRGKECDWENWGMRSRIAVKSQSSLECPTLSYI